VRVQGETSAAEVAAAIDGFNALAPDGAGLRPDVLIVARGGGSLEDLMGFNDESVVRAAARSAIPLIAAVGHETDWTLIDHAADVRAPTPTAAAEFAVPVRAELIASLAELDARGRGAIFRFAQRLRSDLRAVSRALKGGEAIVAPPRQRLDRAAEMLATRVRGALDQRALRAAGHGRRLARHSPRALLAGQRERLRGLFGRHARLGPILTERTRKAADVVGRAFAREAALQMRRRAERAEALHRLAARMARAYGERLQSRRAQLFSAWQLLGAMSYRGVLSRGFALVRDETQRPLRRATEVKQTQRLEIEFADGKVGAVAGGRVGPPMSPPALLPRRRAKPDRASEEQGTLF
jgi:exodeoxyribonuclease VII large subunit